MRCRAAIIVAACVMASACGNSQPPAQTPPGSGTETITGRERLGWDQSAASPSELATLRYAAYVDNVRSELTDVSCASGATATGYACSARMPTMSNGTHVIELVSFVQGNPSIESSRSQPFRVTVTGLAPGASSALASGTVITTNDGVALKIDVLTRGLRDTTALAIAPDGRAFVATADGLLMLDDGKVLGPPQLTDGVTLAIAFSPDFGRSGYVFVTQAVSVPGDRPVFRTARVRDMGGWVADRMVILEHGPTSASPAAALRFATDAKLHLAFDDGDSEEAAERMAEWRGKLLRMEPDGRTPPDQAAASPVLWRGLTSPRGFDWSADNTLWLADASRDGVERLRVITTTAPPRRASQRASYSLPKGIGAAAVSFYPADVIPEFTGNLFVAGRGEGYLLRIRFDEQGRPVTTEHLLEGHEIRALSFSADGSMYVVAGDALARLTRPAN